MREGEGIVNCVTGEQQERAPRKARARRRSRPSSSREAQVDSSDDVRSIAIEVVAYVRIATGRPSIDEGWTHGHTWLGRNTLTDTHAKYRCG